MMLPRGSPLFAPGRRVFSASPHSIKRSNAVFVSLRRESLREILSTRAVASDEGGSHVALPRQFARQSEAKDVPVIQCHFTAQNGI
jgi:hypothetical protein